MSIEDEISRSIEDQFNKNERKNLFYKDMDYRQQFLDETKELISKYGEELYSLDSKQGSGRWVDLMTEKAIHTFLKANQFLDIRKQQIDELHKIYQSLWKDIIIEIKEQPINFDELQKRHLNRLTYWLEKSNSFTRQINKTDQPEIVRVICAEYSSVLQLQMLRVDLDALQQPVLDIGCGEHANLVSFLRENGIEAIGMDRLLANSSDHLIQANWMEYQFKTSSWGSIIANHSFTLHFLNHNFRVDGDYLDYAGKYMEIVNSLIPGGVFYYAPDLPFIENYLPVNKFRVIKYKITDAFNCTHIHRLC
jgi:hypothetical protein